MLTEILVEDLGVIERAEVSFEAGSTALTGETGAGKTLLVAAVGLLLGDRADRSLVRTGAERAVVSGSFLLRRDHPVGPALKEAGLVDGLDDSIELVVSRTIEASGGGRARINGRPVTVSLMAEVCGSLIEIAGQHEHHRIGDRTRQREILDRSADRECVALSRKVGELVAEMRAAERTAETLRNAARERARQLDVLRYEVAEIEAVALEPGEIGAARESASRLEHATSIATDLQVAADRLHEEGGVEDLLGAAESAVRRASAHDPDLAGAAGRLEEARIEIADVAEELRTRIVPPDPVALDRLHERLETIGRLQRKYGDDEGSILGYLESSRERVAELEREEDSAGEAQSRADALRQQAIEAARSLSDLRRNASDRLQGAVERWLEELALPEATFRVSLSERDLYEGGIDDVEFLFSANPGEEVRPLGKVASGGELARTSLALQLAAGAPAGPEEPVALIFDEVDAGVGGAAAGSVGRSLAGLAHERGVQVLVVTHLPQVAAFADHHLRVTKVAASGRSRAEVTAMRGEERVAELSRMLAGMPESDRARDHARELLAVAARRDGSTS